MQPRLAMIAVAFGVACSVSVDAQTYPLQPVHILVPYPAGGVVDALVRGVGQHVGDTLGQPVIVDNKPGTNTIIALDACAKAAPDRANAKQVVAVTGIHLDDVATR